MKNPPLMLQTRHSRAIFPKPSRLIPPSGRRFLRSSKPKTPTPKPRTQKFSRNTKTFPFPRNTEPQNSKPINPNHLRRKPGCILLRSRARLLQLEPGSVLFIAKLVRCLGFRVFLSLGPTLGIGGGRSSIRLSVVVPKLLYYNMPPNPILSTDPYNSNCWSRRWLWRFLGEDPSRYLLSLSQMLSLLLLLKSRNSKPKPCPNC